MTSPRAGCREIIVASGNPHKVEEIREILAPCGFAVRSLTEVGAESMPEPVEDGNSFAENARIKAVAYARSLGRMVLADDSGLAVDALGGAPGIHSARWAGTGATRAERDASNNAKLLRELASVPDARRSARFVCALCLATPSGRVVAETRGEYPGVIGHMLRGTNGFGYDPLLVVTSDGRTSAELSPEEKNARSHRAMAVRAMVATLGSRAFGQ
ncbi:MAG: RdgB/HAM1 family non-canonical purine NTP pyrophosphatase [Phycisphaerales bacterium]|nr:RdgB/HAM1 family non-canonical purine NTP pyrophosphatase [Phycisphaerales bacterium]